MEQLAIILCIYNFYTAKCCHCSVSMAWITGGMQPPSAVACLIIDVAQVTVYYAQYFQLKKQCKQVGWYDCKGQNASKLTCLPVCYILHNGNVLAIHTSGLYTDYDNFILLILPLVEDTLTLYLLTDGPSDTSILSLDNSTFFSSLEARNRLSSWTQLSRIYVNDLGCSKNTKDDTTQPAYPMNLLKLLPLSCESFYDGKCVCHYSTANDVIIIFTKQNVTL